MIKRYRLLIINTIHELIWCDNSLGEDNRYKTY